MNFCDILKSLCGRFDLNAGTIQRPLDFRPCHSPAIPAAITRRLVASVLYQRPDNSVVDLTTLNVHNFTFADHEVAELIGLELARLIVDTCYPELHARAGGN